jgi:hypothetical protein
MENYIYINNNSLSKEICKDIIDFFEKQESKYEGVTFGGLDKNIKDTFDFKIPINSKEKYFEEWSKIFFLLKKEIIRNINIYVKKIYKPISDTNIENSSAKFNFFNKTTHFDTFLIQKYRKNVGRYVYHDDQHIDCEKNRYRVLTFIWYLNDVTNGGETEFFGTTTINPEAGKLLLFPATWCFPHRGKIPISNDKYIITGWIYVKN